MAIKFKITNVSDNGTITVEFIRKRGDAEDVCPLNIDIPIVNGEYIRGQELDDYISSKVPVNEFERADDLRSAPDLSHIKQLIGEERSLVRISGKTATPAPSIITAQIRRT